MRGRRHKLHVSTFPFLAVLLCAMGSLILVLLVMDRKAHKAAQARAQREAARLVEETARNTLPSSSPPGEEMKGRAEREQLQQQVRKEWEQKRAALHEKWAREQIELQLQMRKVREELQGIAARLHYEQDTTTQLRRQVQDKRSRIQAEEQLLRTLRSHAKQTENQSKEASQALRRMTLDLLQMEQVLKDLKAARQREQKTFSVVPYHGRRGEDRRPIYVECTADGVIFHPERKAMSLAALIPRSGDLSSDVRTEVERRIAQQQQKLAALPKNVDKTPYLLLLLRPSGVTTYHLFQRALRGLPLDFGYEFIDEDWVLDFPINDELPNTQPWMVATKTPARPAAPPSVTAAPPPQISPRPMGGAPMGNSVSAFTSGIRGFRAGETSDNSGSWGKAAANQSGSPTSGVSNGPEGTGPALPRGSVVSNSQAPLGNPVSQPPGSQALLGNQGVGSERVGNEGTGSEESIGIAANAGRMSAGLSRSNRQGHPSAMPPTFPSDEGGGSFSGDGSISRDGYQGTDGTFRPGAANSGSVPGSGVLTDSSPDGPRSDSPGLGPPRVFSSGSGGGYVGAGAVPSGIAGNGSNRSGVPGNGWRGETVRPGIPGAASGMNASGDGHYVIARGNNGDAPGLPLNNTSRAGSASENSPPLANASGSSTLPSRAGSASENSPPLANASGSVPLPAGQAAAGAPMPANGGRSSEVVIFVDPLTGKPTTAPHPAAPPNGGPAEGPPPEENDGKQRTPRIRVVPANSASNGDGYAAGDKESSAMNRLAPPPPSFAPPPRRLAAPHPAWVHGGRDWTIYVECRATDVVLYPSQRTFPLAQAISAPAGNPLIQAIQKMIDRRQSSRRPGEPPYHPQVCLLVRPEHIRTFLNVYPALEALPVPKTRRNLDADDDVISIVTGAVP
jgi:hypothetical protein